MAALAKSDAERRSVRHRFAQGRLQGTFPEHTWEAL